MGPCHEPVCTIVLMALPQAGRHRPSAMPELEPLDPGTALPLLRSSSWHPDTIGPMLRHIIDWLHDTAQYEAASHLSAIMVTDPASGQPTALPELIGAERSAMSRLESARRRAAKQAMLEQWRAGRG